MYMKLIDLWRGQFPPSRNGRPSPAIGSIEEMIKKLSASPPGDYSFFDSEYFFDAYKRMPEQAVKNAIKSLLFRSNEEFCTPMHSQFPAAKALGGNPLPIEFMIFYKCLKVARNFSLYQVGNCSHRAAYAAIIMAFAAQRQKLRFTFRSYPDYEHSVCVITVEESNTRWIYDPLTNPEMVFGEDFYKANVLSAGEQRSESRGCPPEDRIDVDCHWWHALRLLEFVCDFELRANRPAENLIVKSDDHQNFVEMEADRERRMQAPVPGGACSSDENAIQKVVENTGEEGIVRLIRKMLNGLEANFVRKTAHVDITYALIREAASEIDLINSRFKATTIFEIKNRARLMSVLKTGNEYVIFRIYLFLKWFCLAESGAQFIASKIIPVYQYLSGKYRLFERAFLEISVRPGVLLHPELESVLREFKPQDPDLLLGELLHYVRLNEVEAKL